MSMFHQKYEAEVTKLAPRQKQMVEFLYYIITLRFNPQLFNELRTDPSYVLEKLQTGGTMNKDLIKRIMDPDYFSEGPDYFSGMLPDWVNPKSRVEVEKFVNDACDEFLALANKINAN